MTTRGEAQAQLDAFVERTSDLTVTQFTTLSADRFGEMIAVVMAENLFPAIEDISQVEGWSERAISMAHAMHAIASFASDAIELAVTTSTELGGDELRVGDRETFHAFVAKEQARVDELPEMDAETQAILDDADAMAAIEEAEAEEVVTEVD